MSTPDKAASVNMPYVIERAPMLTNFPTIRKAVKKMATIDKLTNDGTYSNLSKRENVQISRQHCRNWTRRWVVSADLTRLPSALFVINIMKEYCSSQSQPFRYSRIRYR